jgi:predicted nicotinamide N-methyase
MTGIPTDQFLHTFAPIQPVRYCETITAYQATDFFNFWGALENELKKQCVPFWGYVWPAAISLARYILSNESLVKGKSVLDFGCGSGVVSIAAAKAKAHSIIANDIDATALHIAEKNFKVNGVTCESESRNLLLNSNEIKPDLIFVVEMFYERSTAEALFSFLMQHCKRGAEVIIADGGRPFIPKSNTELLFSENLQVNKEVEGVAERTVRILRMTL